jgi:hypothetical protein
VNGMRGGVRGHNREMDGYFLNPACWDPSAGNDPLFLFQEEIAPEPGSPN